MRLNQTSGKRWRSVFPLELMLLYAGIHFDYLTICFFEHVDTSNKMSLTHLSWGLLVCLIQLKLPIFTRIQFFPPKPDKPHWRPNQVSAVTV